MRIHRVEGTAVPVRGDNIDTDRIVPARFLKAVTFEGLEAHVFADDRRALAEAGQVHPFANPAYHGAAMLLVGANFGCGSSREHAPQALARWGIRACVGESFSEIFTGNAVALGLPCARVARADAGRLMEIAEAAPATRFVLDVERQTVRAGDLDVAVTIPPAARDAFLNGLWDATGLLRDRFEEVQAVAARLPYVRGF